MNIPDTEREILLEVMRQAENDLGAAHAEICKLQGLDPQKHTWPQWSSPANTLRWFEAIRAKIERPEADALALHKAYLRLRSMIPGAFDTPHAPTPEQVWETTEAALSAALTPRDQTS